MNYPNEWTQKEFLENKKRFEKEGKKVVLVDTVLSPIEKADTVTYNPYELKEYPEGTIFVFYCNTGRTSLKRLQEYKENFGKHHCISLKGGRGSWRKSMQLLDDDTK